MKTLGVIIPYRDRAQHLMTFVGHMTRYLSFRAIPFQIVVVEQANNKPFNRGKLLNVGCDLMANSCDYFALHDVDMLPESADYSYCEMPTHLATAVSQFGYKLVYPEYFGGATLFDKTDFLKINGYSNEYWGWGVEDDDLLHRVQLAGVQWARRDGRFFSLPHESNQSKTLYTPEWQAKVDKLDAFKRGKIDHTKDGLNTLQYKIESVELHELFILYKVDI